MIFTLILCPEYCFAVHRQQRLQQLKSAAKALTFGSVAKITREQFVSEVTNASRDSWVIVHLYKDKCAPSTERNPKP